MSKNVKKGSVAKCKRGVSKGDVLTQLTTTRGAHGIRKKRSKADDFVFVYRGRGRFQSL